MASRSPSIATRHVAGNLGVLEQGLRLGIGGERGEAARGRTGQPSAVGGGEADGEGGADPFGEAALQREQVVDRALVVGAPGHGIVGPHEGGGDVHAPVDAHDAAADDVVRAELVGETAHLRRGVAVRRGGRPRHDGQRRDPGEMGDERVGHADAEVIVRAGRRRSPAAAPRPPGDSGPARGRWGRTSRAAPASARVRRSRRRWWPGVRAARRCAPGPRSRPTTGWRPAGPARPPARRLEA